MSAPEDHYSAEELARRSKPRPLTPNEQVDCLALGLLAQRISRSEAGRAFLATFCLNMFKAKAVKVLTRDQIADLHDTTARVLAEPL